MTSKKPLIELRGTTKYYQMGETLVKALDGIDICIGKGDFVAIMGPSGSGKSTAMNLTGSLDLTTEGDIYLEEENIETLEESELAQLRGKKIGFIFQQFNLIPNLTAKENVMLPMLFQGIDFEDREEKAEELLKLVNLSDREDHYPNQLSGGQQQRVSIARALANDPEILLADEPTGNLDSVTGEKVMSFLDTLNKEGRTIIIVTHDVEVARKHARTLYSLRDGKVDGYEKNISGKWKKIKIK
ncbi:MAG: ABC transporter ATP-binding protein [Nanoarchaeota archaeon]|nr:ABC transporter ATP-binding protein [Nanoarchaeota archaeon]